MLILGLAAMLLAGLLGNGGVAPVVGQFVHAASPTDGARAHHLARPPADTVRPRRYPRPPAPADTIDRHGHRHPTGPMAAHGPGGAEMIPAMLENPMFSFMVGVEPNMVPFLPGAGHPLASVATAVPREMVELAEGDTLVLEAGLVKRRIRDETFVMYAFNGQYPGPLIRVAEGATVHVHFLNRLDLPSTVHWHGIRLDNRFDGVPHLTQDPVPPGGDFWYEVRFPDAGIYWYHPHVMEYVQQGLGLYGNILVRSLREGFDNPVDREEVLMLDDLLVAGDSLIPFGRNVANFAIMGRFGNVLLVNGEEGYGLSTRPGEVVRFYLTNVSSTRTFNLSFGDAPTKLVGADLGRYEREAWVESVVVAPAQRYVVEVGFPDPGEYPLLNRIQAVDHIRGEFYAGVDTLGLLVASGETVEETVAWTAFERLREDEATIRELDAYRSEFDRPVDHELRMGVEIGGLPIPLKQFLSIDTIYKVPVEFTDPMPDVNWVSTTRDVRWSLKDVETGLENMEIDWRFRVGDLVKVRLRNDAKDLHPMHHPIHVHGQRFLVIGKDGLPNRNLAWKDTVLVPFGSVVDILLELSNPGEWMAHCHISEHLEAGMGFVFSVEGARAAP